MIGLNLIWTDVLSSALAGPLTCSKSASMSLHRIAVRVKQNDVYADII